MKTDQSQNPENTFYHPHLKCILAWYPSPAQNIRFVQIELYKYLQLNFASKLNLLVGCHRRVIGRDLLVRNQLYVHPTNGKCIEVVHVIIVIMYNNTIILVNTNKRCFQTYINVSFIYIISTHACLLSMYNLHVAENHQDAPLCFTNLKMPVWKMSLSNDSHPYQ